MKNTAFSGTTKYQNEKIKKAIENYINICLCWEKIEKTKFERLEKNLKSNWWRRLFYSDAKEYLYNKKSWFDSEFKAGLNLKMIELSEEEKSIFSLLHDYRGFKKFQKELVDLTNLSYSNNEIYVTPRQSKFIHVFGDEKINRNNRKEL